MVHMEVNKLFLPRHKGPLNGKVCPGKNMIRICRGVHDLVHYPIYMEGWGVLPHIIFIIPVMYV